MSKRVEEALEKFSDTLEEYVDYSIDDMCSAFVQGYEQAERGLGWHSVDESLPPVDEEVIVLRNYWTEESVDPLHEISFGHIVDKSIAIDYDGWNVPSVRYWMPMPKLSKEDEK